MTAAGSHYPNFFVGYARNGALVFSKRPNAGWTALVSRQASIGPPQADWARVSPTPPSARPQVSTSSTPQSKIDGPLPWGGNYPDFSVGSLGDKMTPACLVSARMGAEGRSLGRHLQDEMGVALLTPQPIGAVKSGTGSSTWPEPWRSPWQP
jgi:hypothetical protein